jgi:hypothetical protein
MREGNADFLLAASCAASISAFVGIGLGSRPVCIIIPKYAGTFLEAFFKLFTGAGSSRLNCGLILCNQ